MIDEKLKPWLIEINHAPSFSTDTPLDFKIKKDVIADTLQLLQMCPKKKQALKSMYQQYLNDRKGATFEYSLKSKENEMDTNQYKLIYPSEAHPEEAY